MRKLRYVIFLCSLLKSTLLFGKEFLTVELFPQVNVKTKIREGDFIIFAVKTNAENAEVSRKLRPFVGKFLSENFILAKIIYTPEINLMLVAIKEFGSVARQSFMLNKDLRVIINSSRIEVLPTIIRDKSIFISKDLSLDNSNMYRIYIFLTLIVCLFLSGFFLYRNEKIKSRGKDSEGLKSEWINKIKSLKTRQEIENFYKEIKLLKKECHLPDFYFTDFKKILNKYQYMRTWSAVIEKEIINAIKGLALSLEEKDGI